MGPAQELTVLCPRIEKVQVTYSACRGWGWGVGGCGSGLLLPGGQVGGNEGTGEVVFGPIMQVRYSETYIY